MALKIVVSNTGTMNLYKREIKEIAERIDDFAMISTLRSMADTCIKVYEYQLKEAQDNCKFDVIRSTAK